MNDTNGFRRARAQMAGNKVTAREHAIPAAFRCWKGVTATRPSLIRNRRGEGRVAVETSGGVGGLALVGDYGDEDLAGL